MRLILAAASVILTLGLDARGQGGASHGGGKPVFPGQIDLVRMDIVALDASGRPISDLKPDEVWILENGRKQEIVSFVPITHAVRSSYRDESNDVVDNARGDGRLIFLVLDDANSMKTRTPAIKDAATRLVKGLAPEDWVGMLWVSHDRRGALEFTRDHGLVLSAIESFEGEQARVDRWFGPDQRAPGLTRFLPGQLEGGFPGAVMDGPNLKAMFDANRPFLMVKDVSDQLGRIDARRRALVYIGQGTQRIHQTLIPAGTNVPDPYMSMAIAAAKDANVTFHTIDVSDPAVRGAKGLTRTEGARIGEFRVLSDSTGGTASAYSNPAEAAARVVADTSVYYLAGYAPEPAKPREGARRIEVRSTRPGVRLLARKSYVPAPKAPPSSPRDESMRAVRDLVPTSDLSLRAFAATFADREQKQQPVAVVVEVNLKESSMPSGAFAEDVEFTIVAAAPGKGVAATGQVNAKLTLDADRSRNFKGRYLLCARIAIDPGQYQLRIGLRSSAAGRAGSVHLDLSVPDFATRPVSLSSLVIGQATSRQPMPVARGQSIAPLVPFTPSLARDFTPEDEAWAFARLYRGKGATKGPVVVTTTITRLDNDETAWTSSETSAPDLDARHPGEYRVALPLSTLPPGSYRLRIDAVQPGDAPKASRELDFRVIGE